MRRMSRAGEHTRSRRREAALLVALAIAVLATVFTILAAFSPEAEGAMSSVVQAYGCLI